MSLEIHLEHLSKRVDDLEATVKRLIDDLADVATSIQESKSPPSLYDFVEGLLSKTKFLKMD